jgi:hypothetical protein
MAHPALTDAYQALQEPVFVLSSPVRNDGGSAGLVDKHAVSTILARVDLETLAMAPIILGEAASARFLEIEAMPRSENTEAPFSLDAFQ